jgi:hypothetical protein
MEIANLKISNQKTETKNMEVHHHPQVEKKGLKEYLLEGLMIFVAVTLGFFAENIREYYNDRHHRIELSSSLINDLKIDTTAFAHYIQFSDVKLRQIDTLFSILQQPIDKINNYELQRLVVASALNFNFVSSHGTIDQLKSTGLLRLFLDTKIPALINNYERALSNSTFVEDRELHYAIEYIESFMTNHFTPQSMFRVADSAYLKRTNFIPAGNQLRKITSEELVQFSTELMQYKSYAMYIRQFFLRDSQIASDFIKDIQKESGLANE